LDRAVMDADRIRAAALAVPGIAGCHRVRSRGVDGAVLIDMHVLVDGSLPLRDAHALSHRVEDAIKREVPGVIDVTIHVEPEEDAEEGLSPNARKRKRLTILTHRASAAGPRPRSGRRRARANRWRGASSLAASSDTALADAHAAPTSRRTIGRS